MPPALTGSLKYKSVLNFRHFNNDINKTNWYNMKFFITSIGTRGDIEPFLAIGEILSRRGHEVAYSFSEQFREIIPKKSKSYPLPSEILELINSKEGRLVMGKAGVFKKIKALLVLHKKGQNVNKDIAIDHEKAINDFEPEKVIHNPKCSYPIVWSLNSNKENIIVSPVPYVMYPVKHHPHVGINKNLGHFFNQLTYKLSNFGLTKTIYGIQKDLITTKDRFSKKDIRKELFKTKLIFSIAPQLFKRPDYWPKHVQVLGYHERDKIMTWKPSADLEKFLDEHSKILFLTFGSMFNSNPTETSELLYEVISKLKIPCIVNRASGGLMTLEKFETNPNFLFVNNIPYEWIFQRVYAVIHHGGSGTTHMALKYGKPTLIIPHIIDQFGWNNLIHKHGFGPLGISINKIDAKSLTRLIMDLYKNEEYKKNTEKVALEMAKNNLESKLYNFIAN